MLGPSLHKSNMRLEIPAKVANVWTAGLVCGVVEHIFGVVHDVDTLPLLLARRHYWGAGRVRLGLYELVIDDLRPLALSACLAFCLAMIFLQSSKSLQVLQNVELCR